MVSPVCGLRPVRAARSVRSTASQPGMVIFSPAATEVSKTSNSASSTELTAAWLVPALPATSATSSLRFLAIYVLLDGHDFWSLHTACVQTTVRKLTSLAPQRWQIPRVFGLFWGKSLESGADRRQIAPRAEAPSSAPFHPDPPPSPPADFPPPGSQPGRCPLGTGPMVLAGREGGLSGGDAGTRLGCPAGCPGDVGRSWRALGPVFWQAVTRVRLGTLALALSGPGSAPGRGPRPGSVRRGRLNAGGPPPVGGGPRPLMVFRR